MTWEGDGLRLSLAVDAFVFFANIRPAYKWGYIANTVIYSYFKPERKETAIVFWDIVGNECQVKYVSSLKLLLSAGVNCVIVVLDKHANDKEEVRLPYTVQLRDTIGAIVDSKTLPLGFHPISGSMSATSVVLCSERTVYVWQFTVSIGAASDSATELISSSRSQTQSRERMFDIDSAAMSIAQSPELFKLSSEAIVDPITCAAISDKYLVIGQKNGNLKRYILPHLSSENTYFMRTEPYRIELNGSSSKLGYIDSAGVFTILDLDAKVSESEEKDNKHMIGDYFGKKLNIDKRDTWDMRWAEDNDDMICIMEKDKLVVYSGEEAEQAIMSYGYIARFKDLQIKSVFLDDIFAQVEQLPPIKDRVVDYESRGIKDVREIIASTGLEGAYKYAITNNHPRIWKLLAESALLELDLNVAEKSFVKCEDYYGVQLVKQLRSMPDKMKMRAEVAVYLGRFDEAESIYMEIDRKDLAVELRSRLGDFGKVVPLLNNLGTSDKQLGEIWDQIGEFYADRFKWKNASHYFTLSHNHARLAECLYRSENFDGMVALTQEINDGSPLLLSLATKFESIGMYSEAVDCYLKVGNPKAAIDCCVTQNRWDKALELAEAHGFPQVDGLLNKYASSLIQKGKQLEAVELFRRANRPTEAALLIGEIAELAARREVKPGLAKKLHILGALEIERHRKKTVEQATLATLNNTRGTLAQATAATLDTLMMTSLPTQNQGNTTLAGVTGNKRASKGGGGAWRGAAAYHYYMLAQRQLYAGALDAAMKTSIKLCEYDDILEPRDIYSLIVLSSMANNFFGICSKAFVKLETLQEMPDGDRDLIQTLAVRIFSRHTPSDPAVLAEPYVKCLDMSKPYKACVVTGR
jgi:WD repeat-containing protein 35